MYHGDLACMQEPGIIGKLVEAPFTSRENRTLAGWQRAHWAWGSPRVLRATITSLEARRAERPVKMSAIRFIDFLLLCTFLK